VKEFYSALYLLINHISKFHTLFSLFFFLPCIVCRISEICTRNVSPPIRILSLGQKLDQEIS